MKNSTKVIWAVDPFSKGKKLQFATFKALAKLTEKSGAMIEPVAVLSPDQLRVPKATFGGETKTFESKAEAELKSWSKTLKSSRLTAPTLLVQDIYSTHITVDVLLKYARESGASLIGVGSHNKTGLQRFFLGSFAETLILKSDVPVLIVNPKTPVKKRISNILFPTDFSDVSKDAFDKLLPYAKALGAKVTLYFKFEYLLPDTIEAVHMTPDYDRYLKEDLEEKRQLATQWANRAKQANVSTAVVLDQKGLFVPEGVQRAVKKCKADLIAMASHSGAVSTALLGSVARQVVRMATLPVWVIHPTPKRPAVTRPTEIERAAKARLG